jgi:hypothetical protein
MFMERFYSKQKLNIETSYIYPDGKKKKKYFIHVSSFESDGKSKSFTILDQIHGERKFKYTTIRDRQKTFIEAIAQEEIALLFSPIFGIK